MGFNPALGEKQNKTKIRAHSILKKFWSSAYHVMLSLHLLILSLFLSSLVICLLSDILSQKLPVDLGLPVLIHVRVNGSFICDTTDLGLTRLGVWGLDLFAMGAFLSRMLPRVSLSCRLKSHYSDEGSHTSFF